MSASPAGERRLLHILGELGPYLPDVVLIGGWVPYLYRRYGGFPEWTGQLSLTEEADVLVSPPLERGDRLSLAEVLRGVGFAPVSDRSPAAVWENRGEEERIEFLTAHRGTAKQIGGVSMLPEQPGIGAISLPGLDLLARHTSTLSIPRKPPARGEITVTVPTLGAYVLNKAATFAKRSPMISGPNPRSGKDVVYLRDVMAGGAAVRERVASDLTLLIRRERSSRLTVRSARSDVAALLAGQHAAAFAAAVRVVQERDGVSSSELAAADLRGHLELVAELLRDLGG